MKNTKMCKVILIIIATLLVFSIAFNDNVQAADDNSLVTLTNKNNTTKKSTNNSTNNTANKNSNNTNTENKTTRYNN